MNQKKMGPVGKQAVKRSPVSSGTAGFMGANLPDMLYRKLHGQVPAFSGFSGRPAAVLVPILKKEGVWHLLYEERAEGLRTQPGEICFPGGALEPAERPEEAAVRETEEELQIEEKQIRMLAPLAVVPGPGGAPVWAYTAFLEDYQNTWSQDEVKKIHLVPVEEIMKMNPICHRAELKTVTDPDFPYGMIPGGENYPWKKRWNEIWFYPLQECLVWGMTGRITRVFAEKLRDIFSKAGKM